MSRPPPQPLPRSFYDREVCCVARDALGKLLVRAGKEGLTVGRIVEVEAYLAHDDPANHAHRGKTRRNASMFGPPGHAYVYAIHAHCCLNLVTEPAGVPSAVLIRAVEPAEGVHLMQQRRRTEDVLKLSSGPGRLCQAFAIDRALDGWDLVSGRQLWLSDEQPIQSNPLEVAVDKRVGVTAAKDRPLRFFIAASPFVSKPARGRCGTDFPVGRMTDWKVCPTPSVRGRL